MNGHISSCGIEVVVVMVVACEALWHRPDEGIGVLGPGISAGPVGVRGAGLMRGWPQGRPPAEVAS